MTAVGGDIATRSALSAIGPVIGLESVWAALIGQDEAVPLLWTAAAAAAGGDVPVHAMSHSWLFVGPPGSGRSVAARALAAALECDHVADDLSLLGCGTCASCRSVLGGRHPDVHMVVPEGLSISVAEMRQVVATAGRRPVQGHWQVVVIEDADRLTESASNALLKAIEEPPERTVFLLCAPSTHPDDVLVTIRSRCRLVTLRTPPARAVAAALQASGVEPADAAWAASVAQGHVGRAKRLLRDEAARDRRAAVLAIPASLTTFAACFSAADHLVKAAEQEAGAVAGELDSDELAALKQAMGAGGTGKGAAGATRGMAGAVKDLERKQKSRTTRAQRDALDRALVDLAWFYRDVLLRQGGAEVEPVHPDLIDDEIAVAMKVGPAGVLQRLEAVLACREAIELNVKPRVAVEAMTLQLGLFSR